jgi:hypothetical protein
MPAKLLSKVVSLAVLFGVAASAGVIHVPADEPTIQIAIQVAKPFDTIIVAPRTYSEAISFGGKVIVVQSEDPTNPATVAGTIIDAGGLGSVVTFSGGEDQVNTILDGFTITGGTLGIDGHSTRAVIRRCIIRDNGSHGIYQADGLIEDCQVLDNGSNGIEDCDGTFRRCVISGNTQSGVARCDGSISDSFIVSNGTYGVFVGDLDIDRCVIGWNGASGIVSENPSSFHGGDIRESCIVGNRSTGVTGVNGYDSGLVRNTVVAGNRSSGFQRSRKNVVSCTVTGNRAYGFDNHTGTVRHLILWDNLLGGLNSSTTPVFSGTANPFFVRPGFWDALKDVWVDGDYHLSADSPYIDAGDPAYGDNPNNPTIDIDGNPRIVGERVDIGAFEFQAECVGADFDGDGTADVCDRDIDGDGIPNVADRCDFTPAGIPVDSEGRPFADLNLDCNVNLRDFARFQMSLLGPPQ